MGIFDMPVDELFKYQGTNPCPADHDEYWDRAIAEMRAVDPKVELAESDFRGPGMECFDLYFTGVRGARIHAKYARPKNSAGKHPGVIFSHGYTGDSADWIEKASFAAMGFSIIAVDCRGQGGLSEDVGGVIGNTHHGHIIRGLAGEPDNLLMRHIYLDMAQAAGILMDMPEVDETRVGAFGGSQGGGLTLACAALEPRIKLAQATFPFLCDYKRVWQMDLTVNAYAELREYFKHFDPTHARFEETFTKLGYIDVQFLAKRINAEVLMITGLMDMVCPPSTQFAAYNKITSKKDVIFYPDFGHEWLPGANDKSFMFMQGL